MEDKYSCIGANIPLCVNTRLSATHNDLIEDFIHKIQPSVNLWCIYSISENVPNCINSISQTILIVLSYRICSRTPPFESFDLSSSSKDVHYMMRHYLQMCDLRSIGVRTGGIAEWYKGKDLSHNCNHWYWLANRPSLSDTKRRTWNHPETLQIGVRYQGLHLSRQQSRKWRVNENRLYNLLQLSVGEQAGARNDLLVHALGNYADYPRVDHGIVVSKCSNTNWHLEQSRSVDSYSTCQWQLPFLVWVRKGRDRWTVQKALRHQRYHMEKMWRLRRYLCPRTMINLWHLALVGRHQWTYWLDDRSIEKAFPPILQCSVSTRIRRSSCTRWTWQMLLLAEYTRRNPTYLPFDQTTSNNTT